MTYPTFTAGEVLRAADMNAVGLWRTTPTVSGTGVSISKGTITATAATTANVTNCFSSDYDFYKMVIRYQTSTTNDLFMQLRNGAVNAITNYNYSYIQAYLGFGVTVVRQNAQTQGLVGTSTNGAFWSGATVDIMGPYLAEPTTYHSDNTRNDANYTNVANYIMDGNHTTATAYDGLRLFVASGTFTAKFAIYGYNL